MIKKLLCILLAMCCIFSAAAEGETASPYPELDESLRRIMKGNKVGAAVVVVAKDGEIVYEYDWGYVDTKSKVPVSENSPFKVASVTKLISALGIMRLCEDGLLELDTDISDYLGYEIVNPYYPDTPITLRHLMTHTSSLNSGGGYSNLRNTLYDMLSRENRRRGNFHNEEPGSVYRYSNFGAGIMGALMEKVTGQNVHDFMYQTVFEPLGMDAAYHATLLKDTDSFVVSYGPNGKQQATRKLHLENEWDASVDPEMHFRTTVGSVYISGKDLCRLGILLCEGGMLDGVQLLSAETIAEMCSDQAGKGYVKINSPYGLCMHREKTLLKQEGITLYGHQGMTDSGVCNLYFEPGSGFVYVLITSGGNTKQNNRVTHMTRKVFPLMWEQFGK